MASVPKKRREPRLVAPHFVIIFQVSIAEKKYFYFNMKVSIYMDMKFNQIFYSLNSM